MAMPKKVLEKDVQAAIRDGVLRLGYGTRKYFSDVRRGGTPGTPDIIVELRDQVVIWIECKQPATVNKYRAKHDAFMKEGTTKGCSPTEIRQFREQQKLLDLNHDVRIIGTLEEVEEFINELEILGY